MRILRITLEPPRHLPPGGGGHIFNDMVEGSQSKLDAVFHALSDSTRRAMLGRIAMRARTVTELAEPFQMSLAAASKHIKVLESAGLLKRSVRGRVHLCSLDPEPLAEARNWLRFYEQFWSERLDAMEAVIRKIEGPGESSDE